MKNWGEHKVSPEVSICTITYNHEDYIGDAIEGLLMQKTDFPFEILVDDDCSTDKTREIIAGYAKRYPNIIKATMREENIGSMENFFANIAKAKGRYVALCEGDDFWIDPLKLQKQIEIFRGDDEISLVFDNARIDYYSDNNILERQYNFHDNIESGYVNPKELHQFKRVTATAGVVFKNVNVFEFFNVIKDFTRIGDTPTFTYLAKHGFLYYNKNISSVYRQVPTGTMRQFRYPVEDALKDIKYYKFLGVYFSEFGLENPLKYSLVDMYYLTAFGHFGQKKLLGFLEYFIKGIKAKPLYMSKKVVFQLLKKTRIISSSVSVRKKNNLVVSKNKMNLKIGKG